MNSCSKPFTDLVKRINRQDKRIESLKAENKQLKEAVNPNCELFYNQERKIERLRKLLRDALPHIECKNASQSSLITEIGEALEGE